MRQTIANTVLASIVCDGVAHSETPSREPNELRRDANCIIEGKVRAVYIRAAAARNESPAEAARILAMEDPSVAAYFSDGADRL